MQTELLRLDFAAEMTALENRLAAEPPRVDFEELFRGIR